MLYYVKLTETNAALHTETWGGLHVCCKVCVFNNNNRSHVLLLMRWTIGAGDQQI